jgi:hypothetical protein
MLGLPVASRWIRRFKVISGIEELGWYKKLSFMFFSNGFEINKSLHVVHETKRVDNRRCNHLVGQGICKFPQRIVGCGIWWWIFVLASTSSFWLGMIASL